MNISAGSMHGAEHLARTVSCGTDSSMKVSAGGVHEFEKARLKSFNEYRLG